MAKADRELVENALSPDLVEEVWTGNYDKVLPVALQTFEISAVLPVVFYMFRYGHRRGAGNFLATYGPPIGTPAQKRRQTTVGGIAAKLARTEELAGFDAEVEQAILGDLLLCFCLENVRHGLGRDQQVQRVAPTHYLASWIDLPYSVANLRFVPEMIVAMLANRRTGDYVTPSDERRTSDALPGGEPLRGQPPVARVQPRGHAPRRTIGGSWRPIASTRRTMPSAWISS